MLVSDRWVSREVEERMILQRENSDLRLVLSREVEEVLKLKAENAALRHALACFRDYFKNRGLIAPAGVEVHA